MIVKHLAVLFLGSALLLRSLPAEAQSHRCAERSDADTRVQLERSLAEVMRLSALLTEALKDLTLERLYSEQLQIRQTLQERRNKLEALQMDDTQTPADDFPARDSLARTLYQIRGAVAESEADLQRVSTEIERVSRELLSLRSRQPGNQK